MTLCKFFQQGNCKFGNSCRFEHVNPNNRNQPSNRFGALGGGSNQNPADKYNITTDTIEKDLTNEVPQWILSAYAPGRDAPGQLFGGYPREQSFEELRLHFMMGKASGNEQQALNEAQELYAQAQQQMQTALRDVKGAIQFIVGEENNHPNRHDICKQGTQGAPFGEFLVGKRPKSTIADTGAQPTPFGSNNNNPSSPFGGGASTGGGAFGQPSTLGAKPSAFGTPSFGQPSQPAQGGGSVFGQPSQPSAFGQPSQLGQTASAFGKPAQTSTFGQPSQPGSAFGQPSALGAKPNPFGTPAFGQPSQPNAQGSVFGQPSQPNTQGSAFGQPSQLNAQGSAFGQASQLGQKPSPFGAPSGTNNSSSPFGAVANNNNAPAANPFGAPSGSATTSQPANPFGSNSNNQNNAPANPFGQPSQPAQGSSPFGQPSNAAAPAASTPFGASNATSNQPTNSPFGQPSQTQSNGFASQNNQPPASNPFGQPSQQKPANPFGQPSNAAPAAANPFATTQAQKPPAAAAAATTATSTGPYPPNSSRQHPPIESYSSKGMDGRLSMFRGKSVIYKDGKPGIREFDGTWRRIWFPDGPPAFSADTELPPEMYDDKSKAQWMAFAQTGTFEGGLMPELPPPRECTLWDF
ncbi:Nucleoporin AMO1 [Fusarium oxysporum f. sp. rapae]|uniref:Nucleoporin AMO1 n=1 Tax=Fusarium oxysporum f. sp. rapae TaxID=485398 RepID=A0A8J5P590_FUSOX|nr:Nucleoporin AMO1 [Fusarium oxysporum f. sp. rapae]